MYASVASLPRVRPQARGCRARPRAWAALVALGGVPDARQQQDEGRLRQAPRPASVRQHDKFRRKMLLGERYRTDALVSPPPLLEV